MGSAAAGSGSGAARGPTPLDIDPVLIDAAKAGMSYLVEKAAQNERARAQQVEQLDRKIARIRELLEAGTYDAAELLLVDIYWIPVESGTSAEAALAATYDAKRASLTQFLEAKRPRPLAQ